MQIKQLLEGQTITADEIFSQEYFNHNAYDHVLMHHTHKIKDDIVLKSFEPRTASRDTHAVFHHTINEISEEELGLRLRSDTLFCNYDDDFYFVASQFFGSIGMYIIVPKGDYNLYYNEDVSDLTEMMDLWPESLPYHISSGVSAVIDSFEDKLMNEVGDKVDYHAALMEVNDQWTEILHLLMTQYDKPGVDAILDDYPQLIKELMKEHFTREVTDDITISEELFKEILRAILDKVIDNIEEIEFRLREYVTGTEVSKEIPKKTISSPEIMLHCKEFYAITVPKYYEFIEQYRSEGKFEL